jgi:hypothetical protein
MGAPTIAYFSMEVALSDEIPTFSGGLGVLAGDFLRSASDACVIWGDGHHRDVFGTFGPAARRVAGVPSLRRWSR